MGTARARGLPVIPLKPLRERGSSKDTARGGCWGEPGVKGGALPSWGAPGVPREGGSSVGASVLHPQGAGIPSLGKLRHGTSAFQCGGNAESWEGTRRLWCPALVNPRVPQGLKHKEGTGGGRGGTARPPGAEAAPAVPALIAAVSAHGPVPGCISKALIPPGSPGTAPAQQFKRLT